MAARSTLHNPTVAMMTLAPRAARRCAPPSLLTRALVLAVLAQTAACSDDGTTSPAADSGAEPDAEPDVAADVPDSAPDADASADDAQDAQDTDDADTAGYECEKTLDCALLEDGTVCNGTLACDVANHKCILNAATIVACDKAGDTVCTKNLCNAKTGVCEQLAVVDGTACDDGASCSDKDMCKGGSCAPGSDICECQQDQDCDAKDDGDLCTGTLYCDKTASLYTCKLNPGTVITCSTESDTDCRKTVCAAKTGVCSPQPVKTGEPCEWDGNACTLDTCKAGECTSGPLSTDAACECKQTADCTKHGDGNACNGTLYCNKAAKRCEINPATVAHCTTFGDTACRTSACDPKTGACSTIKAQDGSGCDDGVPCTGNEACKAGECSEFDFTCACAKTADCAAVDDKNPCNGALYCNKAVGKCVTNPATVLSCATTGTSVCAASVCDPTSGKCNAQANTDGIACESDGTACTSVDRCAAGVCEPGANHCPCSKTSDCATFDDNNGCNGSLYCDVSNADSTAWRCTVNPASVVHCAAGEPCQPLTYDTKTGTCAKAAAEDGVPCDADGFVCTADACAKGACAAGQNLCVCNDNADCTGYEDGDVCNGSLFCDAKLTVPVCVVDPLSVVACAAPLADACTAQSCNPSNGACVTGPARQGLECDDAKPCTVGDTCAVGLCVGAPAAATALCDDGNACTTGDRCASSACISTTSMSCDDANACTDDACDPNKGCSHANNTAACSDGVACTGVDACVSGACKAGAELLTATVWSFSPSEFVGIVPLGKGYLVAGYGGPPALPRGRVAIIDQQAAITDGGTTDVASQMRFTAVAVAKSGPVAVGFFASQGVYRGHLARLTGTGELQSKPAFERGASERFLGLTAATKPDDIIVAGVTEVATNGGNDGVLLRIDTNNKITAVNNVGAGFDDMLTDVAARGSTVAPYVAIGSTKLSKGAPSEAWWLTFDESLKVHEKTTFGGDHDDAALAVSAAADGGWLVAGRSHTSQYVSHASLWKLNAAGHPVWQQKIGRDAVGGSQFTDVIEVNGVAIAVGGVVQGSATVLSATVALYDAAGRPMRTEELKLAGEAQSILTAVVADSSSTLAVVGASSIGGQSRAVFARLGAFGDATCAAAGACFGKSPQSCQDGDACTIDTCVGKGAGCQHNAAVDGATCEDGNVCTSLGTCKSGTCASPTPVWEQSATDGQNRVASSGVQLSDGKLVVAGWWVTGSNRAPWWVLYDADSGTRLHEFKAPQTASKGRYFAIAKLGSGKLALVGERSGSTTDATISIGTASAGQDAMVGFASVKGWASFSGVATDAQSIVAAGTTVITDGSTEILVAKVDATELKTTWSATFGGALSDSGSAVRLLADGDMVIAGALGIKGSAYDAIPWVAKVSGAGKLVWQRTYDAAKTGWFIDLALVASGVVLAGHTSIAANTQQELLVAMSTDGDFLHEVQPWQAVTPMHRINALAVGHDGTVLAVGQRGESFTSTAKPSSAMAQLLSAELAFQGSRAFNLGTRDAHDAAVALADGRWAIIGNYNQGTVNYATIRVLDRYLNATCVESQGCVHRATSDCADGDACTLTTCAAGVCKSTASPLAAPATTARCALWRPVLRGSARPARPRPAMMATAAPRMPAQPPPDVRTPS